MELKKVTCTTCGGTVEIDTENKTAKCNICGNSFVVEIAEKLNTVEENKSKDLKNLRKLLDDALSANDIKNIDKCSGKILQIIPEDYLSKYLFAYSENALGKNTYISDFYGAEPTAHTLEEIAIIVDHINNYSDLRDRVKIESYLRELEDINSYDAITNYKQSFRQRQLLEENYDDVPRDVFICHQSTNIAKVNSVVRALEDDGNKCWVSTRNLRKNDSENYWDNIEKAVKSCKIFLVVSSQDAMLSKDVKNEINIAKSLGKPRIEYKIDIAPHTTFFKEFFDGSKWVEDNGDEKNSLLTLCHRVFAELEQAKQGNKKPTEFDRIKELIENQKTVGANSSIDTNVNALLKKAKLQVEDGDFRGAADTCNRVSDINVENGELWLLRLLIDNSSRNLVDLSTKDWDISANNNYNKVLRFATPEISAEVSSAIEKARQNYQNKVERERRENEEKARLAKLERERNEKIVAIKQKESEQSNIIQSYSNEKRNLEDSVGNNKKIKIETRKRNRHIAATIFAVLESISMMETFRLIMASSENTNILNLSYIFAIITIFLCITLILLVRSDRDLCEKGCFLSWLYDCSYFIKLIPILNIILCGYIVVIESYRAKKLIKEDKNNKVEIEKINDLIEQSKAELKKISSNFGEGNNPISDNAVENGTPIHAPKAGKLTKIAVKSGTRVRKGIILFVLDAMKGNYIVSPCDGIVTFAVIEGTTVQSGDIVAYILEE